jgi:deazaflavin-dependent oxidoreductase (nitroreductase family)
VAATAGGSPKHPVWVHTLRRADTVTVEAPGDPIVTAPVTVAELEGAERDKLWERFKGVLPSFAGYEEKSGGRVFPIFRLAP